VARREHRGLKEDLPVRFPLHFVRTLPTPAAPLIGLGADTVPSTAPDHATMDNLFVGKFVSNSGFPVERLAIGYKYTGAGPAVALPCQLWIWEDKTQAWYLLATANLSAPGTSGQGTITPLRVLSGAEAPSLGSDYGGGGNIGSLTVLIIVQNNSAPNGTYDFVVAPNLTAY
jgi:hypothetical protein